MKNIIIFLFSLTVLGCFAQKDERVFKLSTVRPLSSTTQVTKKVISHQDYTAALKNTSVIERIRLVPILKGAASEFGFPEYRLFDIDPASPAGMLGLKNSDILVAANDFIIYEPQKFKAYLMLLGNESSAEIEIRREGQSILFKYSFQ